MSAVSECHEDGAEATGGPKTGSSSTQLRSIAIAGQLFGGLPPDWRHHEDARRPTTNQAAIIALFRVVNRYVGNLPPFVPSVLPS